MAYWRLFYHIVWATRGREALLDEPAAGIVERSIRATCRTWEAVVHAVSVMPDHGHLVVSIPPSIAVSTLIGRVKGASSHVLRHPPDGPGIEHFAWQAEYGVLSFGEKALPDVVAYVANQTERHAGHRLWDNLERVADPSQPTSGGFVG
ncbi:MAG: IS200/IS605 family transposase [Chloroflexota bacterium]|nr:IS200/IS605 family transposase [Chloroflexota bacterium]